MAGLDDSRILSSSFNRIELHDGCHGTIMYIVSFMHLWGLSRFSGIVENGVKQAAAFGSETSHADRIN